MLCAQEPDGEPMPRRELLTPDEPERIREIDPHHGHSIQDPYHDPRRHRDRGAIRPASGRRMAVDVQEYRPTLAVHQALEEVDEYPRAHPALDDHEAQRTPWADRRDHIETEALTRDPHDRRLAAGRPGAAAVEVRAHPGLILEENLRFLAFRQRSDPRILALHPLLDPRSILLVGPPQRLLTREAQLPEQPANRHQAQAYPTVLGNQFGDHPARPQREWEAQL